MEGALEDILLKGTQRDLLPDMQTRAELYDLIRYSDYERMDSVFQGEA